MKTYKEILEAKKPKKMTAQSIVKMFKNSDEWGDQGDTTRVVKGNLEVVDTYFYGGAERLKALIKDWTDVKSGSTAMYFKQEHDVTFKLADQFEMVRAQGRYKKLTSDGIVGIVLKVKQG